MISLLALLPPALACQPERRVHWQTFPAPGSTLPANGRVVLEPYGDDGMWRFYTRYVGLVFTGASSVASTSELLVPGADSWFTPRALRPTTPLAPGPWTLTPSEPFDADIVDAKITAGEAAEGRRAFGIGPELERFVVALPTTGWTVTADLDLTPPRWIGEPEIAAKDHPECYSAGGGPGWGIDIGMTEPVLLVGQVKRAPDQPAGAGWLAWSGTWTNEDLHFVVRWVSGDADLEIWAVDAAGNVTAEPLRLQARGEALSVAPLGPVTPAGPVTPTGPEPTVTPGSPPTP